MNSKMIPMEIDKRNESLNHQTTPNTRIRHSSSMSNTVFDRETEPAAKRQKLSNDSSDITIHRTIQVTGGTLFSDGLHVIFAFLSDKDWKRSKMWRVNHHWHIAVINMKSRGLTLLTSKPSVLRNLLYSPLRHHVTHVSSFNCLSYNVSTVLSLFGKMIWLRRMTFHTQKVRSDSEDLSPLLRLKQLQHLNISGVGRSEGQLHVLKQLSSLLTLSVRCRSIHYRSAEHFKVLCSPPHQLQKLQHIDLGQTKLDVETCHLLMNLPTLTELSPSTIELDCLPLIEKFPSLTKLRISYASPHDLVPFAQYLHKITHLELRECDFVDEEESITNCTTLMSSFIRLTHLTLTSCGVFSLVGLSAAPRLYTLHLKYSYPHITMERLTQLVGCSTLRLLEIGPSSYPRIYPRLDITAVQQLLPQLTTCTIALKDCIGTV